MIPDEFNLSSHELQILSELDSKQYGLLKLAATEHAKKRALVAKVMIRDGLRGCLGGKSVENVGLFIACVCWCERDGMMFTRGSKCSRRPMSG